MRSRTVKIGRDSILKQEASLPQRKRGSAVIILFKFIQGHGF